MRDDAIISNSRTLSIINFILGVWLIISPYLLQYTAVQARWEQTAAGVIIAILAAVHYYMPEMRWTSWVNAVVALWLIIAPFVTGYTNMAAYWNEIISGVVIGALSIWSGSLSTTGLRSHGHAV